MVKSFWNPESQKLFHLMMRLDQPVSSYELAMSLQTDVTKILFYLDKFLDPQVGLVKKTTRSSPHTSAQAVYELVRPSYILVLDGVTVVLVNGRVKVLGCVYEKGCDYGGSVRTCQENCSKTVGSDKCLIWQDVKKYTKEQIGAMETMLNGEKKKGKVGGSGGRKGKAQHKRLKK